MIFMAYLDIIKISVSLYNIHCHIGYSIVPRSYILDGGKLMHFNDIVEWFGSSDGDFLSPI